MTPTPPRNAKPPKVPPELHLADVVKAHVRGQADGGALSPGAAAALIREEVKAQRQLPPPPRRYTRAQIRARMTRGKK